ncbi:MAG: cysteine hydrolase [Deltaproteobacteria bacterium]|nr:cysteine hydrolase [Deltaproteobacteria bacterium]
MSRALLVIDMLNDFVDEKGSLRVPDTAAILPRVAQEVVDARARGESVVYVCDAHRPDDPEFSRMGWPPHAVRGTWGARVVDALAPGPSDPVVEKTTYSGFHGSDLDRVLREREVRMVRLVGCVTNICVLYTAADAAMRGYGVEVVRDAVAGLDPEDHAFALRQMERVLGARLVDREAP